MAQLSFSVLRIRAFRLLLLSRFFSTMALQAQAVIVGWQVYSITKDVFMLGLVGLAEAIPAILSALFAGYIVDIHLPRKVYTLCSTAIVINTLLLFLAGGNMLPLDASAVLACLFIGVFISGIIRSFTRPSSSALLPQTVGRKNLPAALAWQTTGFQSATLMGPALAGLIYGGYGAHGAWIFPLILTTLSFLLALAIRPSRPEKLPEKTERALEGIKAGWRFIWKNQILLPVMTLDMVAVLFGGVTAMLPAYADQILHVGSEGLGVLRSAPALGGVAISLYFAVKPMRYLSAANLLWIIAAYGLCILCFSMSKIFLLSVVLLIILGLLQVTSVMIRWTMIQVLTPEHMLGRVISVNSMFVTSSEEIGAFESGIMARLMGLVPSVAFGGLVTLSVACLTALVAPKFRRTVVDTEATE